MDWWAAISLKWCRGKSPGRGSGRHALASRAITGNYNAFLDEGLSPDQAVAETLDCYPGAGVDRIKAILHYRAIHEFSLSLEGSIPMRMCRMCTFIVERQISVSDADAPAHAPWNASRGSLTGSWLRAAAPCPLCLDDLGVVGETLINGVF